MKSNKVAPEAKVVPSGTIRPPESLEESVTVMISPGLYEALSSDIEYVDLEPDTT